MVSIRSFALGAVVGFGAGVAFRSLADRDFEPIKSTLMKGASAVGKVTEALADTFGKFRETLEDVQAEWRHNRIRSTGKKGPVKAQPSESSGLWAVGPEQSEQQKSAASMAS